MKNICLQAGHINVANNVLTALRTSTGAPGEQELTLRITSRVASILRGKGFNVKQTDANANSDSTVTTPDWDLFLAIHGDADVPNDNGGGMVGVLDPAQDSARVESGRIKEAIRATYFNRAGIVDKNYTTAAILGYYMWRYLSLKTPCVLIELGQVQDPHDKVLLADTDRISNALARAICDAFGVPFDPPVVIPPPAIDPKDQQIKDLQGQVETLKSTISTVKSEGDSNLAACKADCQKRVDQIGAGLVTAQNTLTGLISLTKPL